MKNVVVISWLLKTGEKVSNLANAVFSRTTTTQKNAIKGQIKSFMFKQINQIRERVVVIVNCSQKVPDQRQFVKIRQFSIQRKQQNLIVLKMPRSLASKGRASCTIE